MKLSRRLLVLVVTVVSLFSAGSVGAWYPGWQFDPYNFPTIKDWAGCRAGIVLSHDDSPMTSYYLSDPFNVLVIGVRDDEGMPYYAGLLIFLHEVGHCLQDQNDELRDYAKNPKPYELDADRVAADLACAMGLDGRGLLRDLFIWARDRVPPYHGDIYHGTLEERIAQGLKAKRCDKPLQQSFNAEHP